MVFFKTAGFTLLELTIVLIIVGGYALFHSPAHEKYLMKTKRLDAKKALVNLWHQQQTYQQNCGRYAAILAEKTTCVKGSTKASDYALSASTQSPKGYYQLSVIAATETGYTLQAVPVIGKSQANDSPCAKLTLDNLGTEQSYNGQNQPSTECWKK
jgi:type IV pilus assembly protein PilE